jgi:hypothetical protein
MNAILRGGRSSVVKTPTRIETYRQLSEDARANEWENLTEKDQQTALAEGIAPRDVESIGGKADGGAGGDRRSDLGEPGMNDLLRDARHGMGGV